MHRTTPYATPKTQKTELLNSHLLQIGCCNQRFWHSGKLLSGLGRAHRIDACLIHLKNYQVNGATFSKWFKTDKETEEKVNPEDRRGEGIHSKGRKGKYIQKGRKAGINNTIWISIINFLEAQDHQFGQMIITETWVFNLQACHGHLRDGITRSQGNKYALLGHKISSNNYVHL